MRKVHKIWSIILVVCIFCLYIYCSFPRAINLTYDGIKYTIGDLQQQEQVKINIIGFYYNKLFTRDYFAGSISVDNETYPRLKLLVGEELQLVSYRDYEKDGTLHNYGEIFIGEKFKDLTICVQAGQGGWNSENGFMVSAPAKNRVVALEISNKLMKNVLKYKLE